MQPGAPVTEQSQTYTRRYQQWDRELAAKLLATFGTQQGRAATATYGRAFSPGYREDSPVAQAVEDIASMQGHPSGPPLGRLYRIPGEPAGWVRFRICWAAAAPLVQEVLPIFAGLGLRVADHRSYEIRPAGRDPARIDDFGLLHDFGDLTEDAARLVEDAFAAMWTARAEQDGFNRLVLTAGLPWRQAAYRYLWRPGSPSAAPMWRRRWRAARSSCGPCWRISRCCGRRWMCCATAGSARSSRPAARPIPRPRTRPTTPSGSTPTRCGPGWWSRAAIWASRNGPASSTRWPGAG